LSDWFSYLPAKQWKRVRFL